MKKQGLSTFFILFFMKVAIGQYAYQDALFINSELTSGPQESQLIYATLLNYYSKDEIESIRNGKLNPFLSSILSSQIPGAHSVGIDAITQNAVRAKSKERDKIHTDRALIPNLSFSQNLAIGFVDFIIDRANDELVLSFLQNFKNILNKEIYKDVFRSLFPQTHFFLSNDFEPVYLQRELSKIRESLKSDLRSFDKNYPMLFKLPLFTQLINGNPDLDLLIKILTELPSVLENSNISVGLNEFFIKYQEFESHTNILAAYNIFSILSISISDKNTKAWLSDFTALMENEKVLKLYFGLLVANLSKIIFTNEGAKVKDVYKEKVTTSFISLNVPKRKYNNYSKAYNSMDADLSNREDGLALFKLMVNYKSYNNDDLLNFASKLISTIKLFDDLYLIKDDNTKIKQQILLLTNIFSLSQDILGCLKISLPVNWMERSKQINDIIYNGLMLSMNFKEEQFEEAIINFSAMISASGLNFLPTQSFLKYGTFLLKLSSSSNSDEVKSVLKSYSLPIGSSALKKNSTFSLGIQSYFGLFSGFEKVNLFDSIAFIGGVHLPVGLDLSWGTSKSRSNTIFFSLLNMGNLAEIRIGGSDEIQDIPSFRFSNFISPGIYYMHGVKNFPISIGGGFDYRYKYGIKLGEENNKFSAWQFKLGIAVDIPLLILHSRR